MYTHIPSFIYCKPKISTQNVIHYPPRNRKPETHRNHTIYNVRRNVFPFLFFHFFHPCAFYGSHEESPPTGHPFVRAEVYTWLHLRVRKPEAVDWSKHARAHFYPRINIPARHVYIGIHTGTWHRGKTTHQPIRQT